MGRVGVVWDVGRVLRRGGGFLGGVVVQTAWVAVQTVRGVRGGLAGWL